MSLTSLTYAPSIRRGARPPRPDFEKLETAMALADEGHAQEAMLKGLEHLFPSAKIPDLATEAFCFTQGSSRVEIRTIDDELVITVPLVRLPSGGNAIAALRFVLTKISSTGQLYQPRLRGDDVYLEYRDKLSRVHPAKLVEVLRRMPVEADDNDDWLIGQFSALPLDRAAIDPLDDDELHRCEAIWRDHWHDIEELLKESQRKRSMFFLNEVTAYAIYRIKLALPMCGFLAAKIAESAGTFNDTNEDPLKREAALAKCAKDMKAVGADELRANLGHATYAISPLGDGTAAMLTGYFGSGNYIESIDRYRSSGKSLDAALALICTYNYLLAAFVWSEAVAAELDHGLTQASGKPWHEAADLMWNHAKQLVAKFGENDEGDQK